MLSIYVSWWHSVLMSSFNTGFNRSLHSADIFWGFYPSRKQNQQWLESTPLTYKVRWSIFILCQYRSSHPRRSTKKTLLKIPQNLQKTSVSEFLFRKLGHKCFPVNFAITLFAITCPKLKYVKCKCKKV